MTPLLRDDPAWVRYEWELRHLPLLALRQALLDQAAVIADRLLPALERLGAAFLDLAATPAFRDLAAALEGGGR